MIMGIRRDHCSSRHNHDSVEDRTLDESRTLVCPPSRGITNEEFHVMEDKQGL